MFECGLYPFIAFWIDFHFIFAYQCQTLDVIPISFEYFFFGSFPSRVYVFKINNNFPIHAKKNKTKLIVNVFGIFFFTYRRL